MRIKFVDNNHEEIGWRGFVDRLRFRLGLKPKREIQWTNGEVESMAKEIFKQSGFEEHLSELEAASDPNSRGQIEEKWEKRIRKREIAHFGHPLMPG